MSAQSQFRIRPAKAVRGAITVPGDKSISHRALMLGGIAEGRTEIRGFLESEDCLATLRAMQALGVTVARPTNREVIVQGVGPDGLQEFRKPLDMGNAGTAMRLFTGLLAGQPFDSTLVGDSSLMKRPMERVATPLRQMGARIDTDNGRPPVRIHVTPRMQGIDYALPVASAQVKSAILLAGLYADGVTAVTEPAVTRDHTERMLRSFGATVEVSGPRVVVPGRQVLRGCALEVPGDFSSAAFFIVAACLAADGPFVIRNVGLNPTRTGLLDILRSMGAVIRVTNPRTSGSEPVADLEIERADLRGIRVPPESVPLAIDEFPVLFVAAACAQGETVVTGAEELRVKESDRIAVMAKGLETLGVRVEVLPGGMRIQGRAQLGSGRIDSHGDHRIAMAFAVASVRASDTLEVTDVANVATSFPGFEATARAAGLDVALLPGRA